MMPPLPTPSALTEALSSGLRTGLSLQHCVSCGLVIYYPRVVCPECLSSRLEWRPVSGLGEVFSFGIIHRTFHPAFASQVPLCLCTVRLAEGPMALGLLEGCAPGDGRIGMAVRAVGRELSPGVFVLRFAPTSP